MSKENFSEDKLKDKGFVETSPGVWEKSSIGSDMKKANKVIAEGGTIEESGDFSIVQRALNSAEVDIDKLADKIFGNSALQKQIKESYSDLLLTGKSKVKFTLKAKTAKRQIGKMNSAEKKYSEHLNNLVRSSEILDWAFEPEKFRLADNTYYTPDFRIIKPDGAIEFHEVKAFWKNKGKAGWQEDARVKIKVAAEQHPYPFIAVCLNKDQWQYESF